jgi:hypothetical protein
MKKLRLPLVGFVNPLLLGGVLIFVVLGFSKLYKAVSSFFSPGEHELANTQIRSDQQAAAQAIQRDKLTKEESFYTGVAEFLYNQMQYIGSGSGAAMVDKLKNLTAQELKFVWVKFGIRSNTVFAFSMFEGDLFAWFDAELSDWKPWDLNALSDMRKIWTKTGLWV